MKPWLFKNEPFKPDYGTILCNHWYGFVYRIDNIMNDRSYIGQKSFLSLRGKGKSESNWEGYWGSCEPLTNDLIQHGEGIFTKTILSLHTTKDELSYYEVKHMFEHDVLFTKNIHGLPKFYNQAIFAGRFLKKDNKVERMR